VQLVPEFIQEAASAEAVAAAALRLLRNEGDAREKVLLGYQRLNARLGGPGAAAKAAAIILQTISPQADYVDLVETSVR
jgi:lipid A disaccharide synthetase